MLSDTHERQPRQKHPYSAKMMALSVYAETLSATTASQRTGIPHQTIHEWLKEEESDAFVGSLRQAVRSAIAHELVEVSVLAVAGMKDRLINGDPYYDIKRDNVIYLKVKAKDCASIASIAIDKFTLLTGVTAASGTTAKVLDMIQARLVAAIKEANAPQDSAQPALEVPKK